MNFAYKRGSTAHVMEGVIPLPPSQHAITAHVNQIKESSKDKMILKRLESYTSEHGWEVTDI